MKILEKITKWSYGKRRTIPYYPGIGYIYRIPKQDNMGTDLWRETIIEWIEEKVKKGEHFSIQMIVDDK